MRGHDRVESRTPAARAIADRCRPRAGRAASGWRSSGPSTAGRCSATPRRLPRSSARRSLVPAIIFALARGLRAPLRRLLGVEGLLAHANLAAAIPRLSISIAALAVSLSMMVAVAVMIGSFRETVVYWVGQTLQADLFIGPGDAANGRLGADPVRLGHRGRAARIRPSTAVDTFRNIDLVYQGNLVVARRRDLRRRAVARLAAVQGTGATDARRCGARSAPNR